MQPAAMNSLVRYRRKGAFDVVWAATDPEEGGHKVVGWYRYATLFRERQEFAEPPSRQHARVGTIR